MLLTDRAGGTPSACRDETQYDVVAWSEIRHTWSDFDDHSRTLVAPNTGKSTRVECLSRRRIQDHVAGNQVLVRVAQTRRRQLDKHFTSLGRIEFDFLHAPLRVGVPQSGCFAPHGVLLRRRNHP